MVEQKQQQKVAAIGVAGGLLVLLAKFKIGILSIFKLGWLLKSSGTMLLSFGVYAMSFGWQWALFLMGLIYVHEMGHFAYMKAKGLNPSAPVFVPFVGAYVAMNNLPTDPVVHAWVAFAGPLAGGLAAAALYALGLQQDSNLLISAANWGFMINLLQLVPVRPFDGGFIAECISKWLAIPGIVLLVAVAIQWQSPLLIILSAASVFSTFRRFSVASTGNSVVIPRGELIQVTLLYFWLAWALAYCYWQSEMHLKPFLQQHT